MAALILKCNSEEHLGPLVLSFTQQTNHVVTLLR